MKQQARKRRSDRNHIIYLVTAPDAQQYVGLTVVEGTALKSLKRRWLKHVNRATNEQHLWALCEAIRQHGAENFSVEILEKVRGKAAAHSREVELIAEIEPELNTARTGKGKR
jgi:hypothetical protein